DCVDALSRMLNISSRSLPTARICSGQRRVITRRSIQPLRPMVRTPAAFCRHPARLYQGCPSPVFESPYPYPGPNDHDRSRASAKLADGGHSTDYALPGKNERAD
uniref:Uncharacterized protein n=1 Tax=Hippocampus comes TaxID=109280 RepID=A0A3Q2YMR7_HIPCM